jgi:hypothetical protein
MVAAKVQQIFILSRVFNDFFAIGKTVLKPVIVQAFSNKGGTFGLLPQNYQHRLILATQSRSFRSIIVETGQKSV